MDGFEAILQYIEEFKDNPIIVFPQSVFFSDTEDGKKWLKYSQKIVQNTSNLTIFARDKVSFNYLKKYYPFTNIKLAPDTVLAYKPKNLAIPKRRGIILCFCNDKEKGKLDFRKNVLELLTKKI